MGKTQHSAELEAGRAARKGRWDLMRLVPINIKKSDNMSAFLEELLAQADITGELEEIAKLFLAGCGVRQVSRAVNSHRVEVQKSQRKIYRVLQKVIVDNPLWVKDFQPGDRKRTSFVINRNRRKIHANCEPHLYGDDDDSERS